MPELPDVEGWKRYVARYAAGRRVRRVHVRDAQVLRNTSPQGLGRALHGRRLRAPRRHGKWLLVPVGDGHLVLHFGMTGELAWSSQPDPADASDLVELELDGGTLRYRAQRKLGGVWWTHGDVRDVTGPLGPDAADVDRARFREQMDGRRGGIKSALMDQQLIAGIGNELSDEVLWRARVRPDARVADLSGERLDAVHRALARVLRRAMAHGGIPARGRWLNAVRGDDDPHCPRCGTALEKAEVAGRTAWLCPHCQG